MFDLLTDSYWVGDRFRPRRLNKWFVKFATLVKEKCESLYYYRLVYQGDDAKEFWYRNPSRPDVIVRLNNDEATVYRPGVGPATYERMI